MTISWFRFIPGLHSSTSFTAPATDRYAKPARRLHLRSAPPPPSPINTAIAYPAGFDGTASRSHIDASPSCKSPTSHAHSRVELPTLGREPAWFRGVSLATSLSAWKRPGRSVRAPRRIRSVSFAGLVVWSRHKTTCCGAANTSPPHRRLTCCINSVTNRTRNLYKQRPPARSNSP
jgi:hypothetical protein